MPLPIYFTNPEYPITLDGFPANTGRWVDLYASIDGGDIQLELDQYGRMHKAARDVAYQHWLRQHGIRPRLQRFQAIRVLSDEHSEKMDRDWWRDYKDAIFRVFMNPYTHYEGSSWKQWYILAPEESFLTRVYEARKKGYPAPDRTDFALICPNPEFAKLRMIPTECCQQIWHETKGGEIEHSAEVL